MTEEKKFDRLYIDKKDQDVFEQLREKGSPFEGTDNKDIFIAAMVRGYHEGCRISLKSREGFFRWDNLIDSEKALIKSIAIAEEKDLKVILDKQKIFTVAEEYATGGVHLLKQKVSGIDEFGSYAKKLEAELHEAYNKYKSQSTPEAAEIEETQTDSIKELISKEENESLEFKSSIFWNYKMGGRDRKMALVIAKTVSSFMNSKGGILLVGISDDKKILGLENDIKLCKNADDYQVQVINFLCECIGRKELLHVKFSLEKYDGKDIAVFRVKEAPHPVYVKCDNEEEFYVRYGNTTQPLGRKDTTEYIREKWG